MQFGEYYLPGLEMSTPVYFYTRKRIEDHLMITGFSITRMVRIGKLYFIEAT